jgi:hypothetical protein
LEPGPDELPIQDFKGMLRLWVYFEIVLIFLIPLGALPPVPFLLAARIPTGNLAISKSRVWTKPTAANKAGTSSHRFLSIQWGMKETDSKASSADMYSDKEFDNQVGLVLTGGWVHSLRVTNK